MNLKTKSVKLAGVSIISAVAASLCCVTPVLALISGASGIASTFSWMEPLRPYLLGITFLVLAFAWYQKLKPRTTIEIQCDCEESEKKPFMQTKTFLVVVTVFSLLMMAFPYFGHLFYPKADKKEVIIVSSNSIQEISLNVSGMTCTSCEEHVKNEVNKLPGIISVSANSMQGTAIVKFDDSKTSITDIEKTINKTGYSVTIKK